VREHQKAKLINHFETRWDSSRRAHAAPGWRDVYGEIHEIVVFIATELDETSAGFST